MFSGASAADRYSARVRQAQFLRGTAADPMNPLSPTERIGYSTQALQQTYQAGRDVFDEQEQGISLSVAGSDANVQRAEVFGSPMEVYSARLSRVGVGRSALQVIDARLRAPNLPFPESQDLQMRRAGLQADIDTAPEQARIAAYGAQAGILSDTAAAHSAQFGRDCPSPATRPSPPITSLRMPRRRSLFIRGSSRARVPRARERRPGGFWQRLRQTYSESATTPSSGVKPRPKASTTCRSRVHTSAASSRPGRKETPIPARSRAGAAFWPTCAMTWPENCARSGTPTRAARPTWRTPG